MSGWSDVSVTKIFEELLVIKPDAEDIFVRAVEPCRSYEAVSLPEMLEKLGRMKELLFAPFLLRFIHIVHD